MMRPISRWAVLGLVMPLPAQAAAGLPMGMPSTMSVARAAAGSPPAGWTGLRLRPFSVSRLIGAPPFDSDAVARPLLTRASPVPAGLISFARSSIDQPAATLLLRDAPRFSRLPGKQVEDYEIGLRTSLAGDAVALQAGLRFNKFRNLQTTIRQGPWLMTAAAGKAKVYGVETLARWSPAEGLSLFATYAWREGRLKNRVRDGRKFRLSTDRSATIGTVLSMPAGAGRIAFTPSLAWQSPMGLGAEMEGPAPVALVNAQLGYSLSDRFEIEALATNLLNRPSARPTTGSALPLIAGEPRVLGLRARLRWGAPD